MNAGQTRSGSDRIILIIAGCHKSEEEDDGPDDETASREDCLCLLHHCISLCVV
jgi:hypothetical protein